MCSSYKHNHSHSRAELCLWLQTAKNPDMYYIIQTDRHFFNPLQSNSNLSWRGHNLLLHISSIKPAPIVRADSIIISVELSWLFVTVLLPHFSCHVSERKITFLCFHCKTQSGFTLFWLVISFLILFHNYFYLLMFVDSVFLHFSMNLVDLLYRMYFYTATVTILRHA